MLMPLFMTTNLFTSGLSLTLGLWRLVCSMMMEYERMYAVSVLSSTPPGLQSRYWAANISMMRSIFWASPGKWKLHRNALFSLESFTRRGGERKEERSGRDKGVEREREMEGEKEKGRGMEV